MSIKIMIQFNGKNLTIPINPEELSISRAADNDNIDIIGLGKATTKGEPGLSSLTIKSFFPGSNSYFYTGVTPTTCINFINEIWETENKNNNVAKLVTLGLPIDLDMYFVIDDFQYDHRAGEEEDIYYNLKIKKYVPYGVKTVDVQLSGLAAARATSTSVGVNQATKSTYTVQQNDCLWNITKAACGDGSRWRELYNLNKSIIGSNPNIIKAGYVLTLPEGWTSPQSVVKLKPVAKTTSTATKTTPAATPAAQNNNATSLRNPFINGQYEPSIIRMPNRYNSAVSGGIAGGGGGGR